ncbi:MAG: FAD linked oxidase domain protein [Halothiobacillaceae bacterium]|nr:MAG: FAD linked oxidase domain protein [Halothiobacillaceae bacterium]
MESHDLTAQLQAQVAEAYAVGRALNICAGNSKKFYGRIATGETLDLSGHCGIIHYAPEELVLTARAGTPLTEIETALAERQQMLAFEPPHFATTTTLGGVVATGLSGPRRACAGSVRDFVLGLRLLNGRGERLKFGGEVMKNVAGYDVSRLQTAALGTLGVLLEISLKVLPRPASERTLVFSATQHEGRSLALGWLNRPLPISATAWYKNQLYVRLSGHAAVVENVAVQLGGQQLEHAAMWWQALRDHTLDYFTHDKPLWRLALPATAPELPLAGEWL